MFEINIKKKDIHFIHYKLKPFSINRFISYVIFLEWNQTEYFKRNRIWIYEIFLLHLGINFFGSQRDPNSIIVQFQRKIFILFKVLRQNKFPFLILLANVCDWISFSRFV